jgi:transposase
MHLSQHSLRQLDKAYLDALDEAGLRVLSVKLLADLKEAWDRLNQGPDNSSRPPSRRAPWERQSGERASDEDPENGALDPAPAEAEPAEANSAEVQPVVAKPARKAGKQPGAPGIGRTQVFQAHNEQPHYPDTCVGCGRPLDRAGAVAYTGFQAVDLRWGDSARPGLTLWVVDHHYYEVACACGHWSRAAVGHGVVDPLLARIELSEWRLVGPGLAALIVALALRFRLSRARIQEFLGAWLGLTLSLGTIHQTIHDASAAVAPAEAELLQAVLDSDLLHADETSWPEHGHPLWLWVFTAATVTLYYVAGRGKELVENVLDGFTGWLMSDGWVAYRNYWRRLRCWAHRLRKARGLAQSWDRDARVFGQFVLSTLEVLMAAVYAAREGPPADLSTAQVSRLAALRAACERRQGHHHAKTHALAAEVAQ